MTRFFVTATIATIVFFSVNCFAQKEDDLSETLEDVIKNEQNSAIVQGEIDRKGKIQLKNDVVIPRKSDEQIQIEKNEIQPANWEKMSGDEKKEYGRKKMEDKFILSTYNFKVITAGSSKLCTLNVVLNNNSSRSIKKMRVNYSWGTTKTFAIFNNISPKRVAFADLAMAGDVCTKIMQGADYDVSSCEAEGLNQAQCKLRILPIK